MVKDISINRSVKVLDGNSLNLPVISEDPKSTVNEGETLSITGTNVLKVPFGVRLPRKKKPQAPNRMATLVLPFHSIGSPTPPPHAA